MSGLTKWIDESVRAYEKAHPRTRLPFELADVKVKGSGTEAKASCKAIDDAHEAGTPVLIFVGRERYKLKDKVGKKEHKKTRSFQKKVLNAKSAAKEKEGWAFYRLDLSDTDHAKLAAQLGVTAAPALLAWLPGEEAPKDLGPRFTSYQLAKLLKTTKPAAKK